MLDNVSERGRCDSTDFADFTNFLVELDMGSVIGTVRPIACRSIKGSQQRRRSETTSLDLLFLRAVLLRSVRGLRGSYSSRRTMEIALLQLLHPFRLGREKRILTSVGDLH